MQIYLIYNLVQKCMDFCAKYINNIKDQADEDQQASLTDAD